ncbi:MAG: Aspartyl/glutamyl-tRNA(Asn/Gln) amidotransferase subunit B, partial [Candidatus Levybacteria bacterium GW2011_GWA2_36_13]
TITAYLQTPSSEQAEDNENVFNNPSEPQIYPMHNLPSYKVEVKNINSFRHVDQAINYELKRQKDLIDRGLRPTQETRGFVEKSKSTRFQRKKEEASVYRYFPEPDIPPFHWEKSYINLLRNSLPELPQQKRERFKKEYSIRDMDSEILTREKELADYFEKAIEDGKNFNISPNKIATYIINKKVDIKKILPTELIQQIIKASSVSDIEETELSKIIDETITSNPKAVEDYKTGKENAIMFLVGQVMRKFPQKVDASKIKASLLAKLR